MDGERRLSDMGEGTTAKAVRLLLEGGMRRRMRDIGLIEGTQIRCLNRSPSGDPTAYLIRGAVIALRREDSSKIIVE